MMKISKTLVGFALAAVLSTSHVVGVAADGDGKKSAKEAVKPYPLTVCIVTDNDLGSMGEETSLVYEGQTVKFCCAPCERKFLKNPAKYLAKLPQEARK